MDLVLWRHAEAVDLDPGGEDLRRPLSPRGEKQAVRMAAWLERQLPGSARIWASPALRTQQTVHALQRKCKTHDAIAPQGTAQQLLELVGWPHGKGCAVVVGHQPTLGQAAAQLLGLPGGGCSIRKGAVWWLRYRERDGAGQVLLLSVQSPELL
ncbi:MAG: SixA phosphatase family protein [Rhodoferax sp.]